MEKKKISSNHIIFILISLLFWVYLLGPSYINPLNNTWLYNGDLSIYQLGWKFFKNDIWRFPLGKNPNFGIYFGGSVVFSDSIPFMAIVFKIFKEILPDTFQYFSLWILISIYLQVLISYKIVNHYSNNFFYSFISSLFFLTATIFLYRSGIHLSLMGQWLILLYFLINISERIKFKEQKKRYLILFSSLIHFYFTIILLGIYFLQSILNLKFNFKSILNYSIKNLIFLISLIFLMYIIGYFSLNIDDGFGKGYGYYNYNLNSFFNPFGSNNITSFSWSNVLPTLETANDNVEGFSYLGISVIIFFIIYLFNLIKNKFEIIFDRRTNFFIFVFFLLIAASNNISFGNYNILNLELNKYFYLLLSSVRASGRMIWPIYYLIFLLGIIFICLTINKRSANVIIVFLFVVQIIDLLPGLLNYKFGKQFEPKNSQFVSGNVWSGLSNNFEELRLIDPKNQSELFYNLVEHLISEKYKKTDIAYLARVNRSSIEDYRYNLIKRFNTKDLDLFDGKIYLSKNVSLIKNLKLLYKDKIKIYLLDEIWIVSSKDIKILNPYKFSDTSFEYFKLKKEKKNYSTFSTDEINPFGFGWEFDHEKRKFVSLGNVSSMIFELDSNLCNNKFNLRFDLKKYFNHLNSLKNLKIINQNNQTSKIININNISDFALEIDNDCSNSNKLKINFYFDNPISKYDIRAGLNRKKRAIVLNQFKID